MKVQGKSYNCKMNVKQRIIVYRVIKSILLFNVFVKSRTKKHNVTNVFNLSFSISAIGSVAQLNFCYCLTSGRQEVNLK